MAGRKECVPRHCQRSIPRNVPADGPDTFTRTSHLIEVLQSLNDQRSDASFCDVTLEVEGVKFPAHKGVLASFSPYFKAMFTSSLAESRQSVVNISGVESGIMSLLMDYAYTGTVVITQDNVQSLLAAADLIQVMPVREAACTFLGRQIDSGNAIGIHCFADAHACTDLAAKTWNFLLKNLDEISSTEDFLTLPWSKLADIFDSDELEMAEEAVFETAVRWYEHSPSERLKHFPKILEKVRLCQLSADFLIDHVESHPVVRKLPECRRLVDEAKNYHLLPKRRTQMQQSCRARRHKSTMVKGQAVFALLGTAKNQDETPPTVDVYDPISNTWKYLNTLPDNIRYPELVALEGTVYLLGVTIADEERFSRFFRYDLMNNTWEEKMPMTPPRLGPGLAVLDGLIYAVGGSDERKSLNTGERYDPKTDSWQLVKQMRTTASGAAVVAHDGLLYFIGGSYSKLVRRYNPKTDRWTSMSPMLRQRGDAAACALGQYIYVIGGGTHPRDDVQRYDPRTDTWELVAPLAVKRRNAGVAVIDNKIFVLGGNKDWGTAHHTTIECYSPDDTNTSQVIGDLPPGRTCYNCVPILLGNSALTDTT